MEYVTHPGSSHFVTLTYDDEHLPVTADHVPTLRKSKFTKWIENTARAAGAFRYYAVGEYGDDTLRPHYHLGLFSGSDSQAAAIINQWQNGFTSAFEFSAGRAAYLAKYSTKKLTSHTDSRLEANQEPEFRSSSRRPPLGVAFVPHIVRAYSTGAGAGVVAERGDIERTWRFGGKVYPIPRAILNRCRIALDIPTLHKDRLEHPGYENNYADREFADRNDDKGKIEWMKYDAKKKGNRLRYTSRSL